MTVVAFASVKGAPGVTTLACLVGAAWSAERAAMVIECDAGGGDLASRHCLASRIGWPSLVAASRRMRCDGPIEPHLQQISGGLDVLVGARQLPSAEVMREMIPSILRSESISSGAVRDVIVDLGRISYRDRGAEAWLDQADSVVLCARADGSSLVHVRDRLLSDLSRWRNRVGLVVVGSHQYTRAETERFTTVPVLVELPFDSRSAAAISGQRGGHLRLRRSVLVARAAGLASTLTEDGSSGTHSLDDGCSAATDNQRPRPEVLT